MNETEVEVWAVGGSIVTLPKDAANRCEWDVTFEGVPRTLVLFAEFEVWVESEDGAVVVDLCDGRPPCYPEGLKHAFELWKGEPTLRDQIRRERNEPTLDEEALDEAEALFDGMDLPSPGQDFDFENKIALNLAERISDLIARHYEHSTGQTMRADQANDLFRKTYQKIDARKGSIKIDEKRDIRNYPVSGRAYRGDRPDTVWITLDGVKRSLYDFYHFVMYGVG